MGEGGIEGSASGFHIGTNNRIIVIIIAIVTVFNAYFSYSNYKYLRNKDENEPYELIVKNVGDIQASLYTKQKDSLKIQMFRLLSMHYGKLTLLDQDVQDESIKYYQNARFLHLNDDSIDFAEIKQSDIEELDSLAEVVVKVCHKAMK
jgi:hypothetical protein